MPLPVNVPRHDCFTQVETLVKRRSAGAGLTSACASLAAATARRGTPNSGWTRRCAVTAAACGARWAKRSGSMTPRSRRHGSAASFTFFSVYGERRTKRTAPLRDVLRTCLDGVRNCECSCARLAAFFSGLLASFFCSCRTPDAPSSSASFSSAEAHRRLRRLLRLFMFTLFLIRFLLVVGAVVNIVIEIHDGVESSKVESLSVVEPAAPAARPKPVAALALDRSRTSVHVSMLCQR